MITPPISALGLASYNDGTAVDDLTPSRAVSLTPRTRAFTTEDTENTENSGSLSSEAKLN